MDLIPLAGESFCLRADPLGLGSATAGLRELHAQSDAVVDEGRGVRTATCVVTVGGVDVVNSF